MKSRFINSDILDNIDVLLSAINKLSNYKQYCYNQLCECDKYLSDLDHYLELKSCNCVKMTKLISKRKKILSERRFYKDEIACIEAIESANKLDTQSIHKNIKAIKSSLKDTIDRLENRIYTPRVAFDLFEKADGCNT